MQNIRWKSAFLFFHSALALAALGVSYAYYYSNTFYQIADFVYGSDSLYLPALLADILHGNQLAQWNLPPSSYFFPDALIYFVASAITPEIHAAISMFAATQYLIFVIGMMLLAVQVLPRSYRALIPGLIALASLGFAFAVPNLEFYSQMLFISAHHFGVMLMTPFIVTLTHRALSASRVNALLISLGVLSFLTTLSDWLYLVQVAIPLAASLAILGWLKKLNARRALIATGALIAPSLLGLGTSLMYILSHPMLVAYLFRSNANDGSLFQLGDALSSLPLFQILLAIIFLGICAFTFAPIILRKPTPANLNTLVPLYFLLVVIINVSAVAASGLLAARDGLRYFLPMLIFPAFWGLLLVVPFPRTQPKYLEWAIAAILGLGIFFAWQNLDWAGLTWEYHPTTIACLDEKTAALGIHYGIANYWQARPITLLSQNNLRVVQVNRDLAPYHWINNSAEYAIEPEFVVIDSSFAKDYPFRLDENIVTARFGKPDAVFQCEQSDVLVYRSNKFKFQFRNPAPK